MKIRPKKGKIRNLERKVGEDSRRLMWWQQAHTIVCEIGRAHV